MSKADVKGDGVIVVEVTAQFRIPRAALAGLLREAVSGAAPAPEPQPARGKKEKLADAAAFMTTPEVAAYLGLSRQTVWRMVRDGDLKASRFRTAWRIEKASVDEYVRSCAGDG